MLTERPERASTGFEAVLAAARDVTSSLDLSTVLDRILDNLQRLVPGHHAEVLLLGEAGDHLYVAACRGRPYPGWQEVRLPLDQGVCGGVVREGRGEIVPRVMAHAGYIQRWGDVRSEVAAPLVYAGRVLGVLNMESEQAEAYGPADLEVLELFASLAAVAIENARLHDRVLGDNARLRDLDRMRTALMAAVSHDYKNPLAVIIGRAILLRRERPPAERDYHLRLIEDEAMRLARLVDELLEYARGSERPRAVRRETVDLVGLVRDAVARTGLDGGRPEGRRAELALPAGSVDVELDADAIARVLGNLLDNAVKYSPAGGPITVELTARPGEVEVRIRDRGLGLAPAELEVVFDPYRRASGLTPTIKGTGLGLAICRQIVDAHGGCIWAESEGEGRGSTFVFRLPRRAGGSSPEPERDRGAR